MSVNGLQEAGPLRQAGDATVTFWTLSGLAAGVPVVALWEVSWEGMALLSAGLAAGAVLLGWAVAAGLRRAGKETDFLEPSVRQGLLISGLAAIAIQAAIVEFRPLSIEREKDRTDLLDEALKDTSDPGRRDNLATAVAVREAAENQYQSSQGEQKEVAELVLEKVRDGDDPLPILVPPVEETPAPQVPATDQERQGTPAEPSPTPSPAPAPGGRSSAGGNDLLSELLRILTGPLGALVRSLFGLGGGEEYRRLATQAVTTLGDGQVPSPQLLSRFLESADPDQEQKALEILGKIARRSPGVDAAAWNAAAAKALMASRPLRQEAQAVLEGLRQGKTCQEVAKEILVEGVFRTPDVKEAIGQALLAVGREDCWKSSFEPVPVRGER